MSDYVPDGSGWISEKQWDERTQAAREANRRNPELARRVLAGQRRALSVRRPWAHLILAGHKTVENRTWQPPGGWRGDLVVHAGQKWVPDAAGLAAALGITGFESSQECPGGYLGLVRLVDVHPSSGCCAPWGQQDTDTYHWVLAEPRPFAEPIPGRGRLGLYWTPADLHGHG